MTSGRFHTTRWTVVLAASGDSTTARDALRLLCEAYYAPVFTFIRHYRAGADDARDVTHDFFAKLLEGNSLARVNREHGRFRSYLLGAVKHFLADHRDRESAQKRGGGSLPLPLDAALATPDASAELPDDAYFDREWALTLLARSLERLEQEAAGKGEAEQIAILKPWLVGDAAGADSAAAAARLRIAENSLKVLVHRVRKRFRELVKEELSTTVADENVGAELDYLIRALAVRGGESAAN